MAIKNTDMAALDLVIRTVRSRGYLLEERVSEQTGT